MITPEDRATLRAMCERVLAETEASGNPCPPVITMLPVPMVLALLDMAEGITTAMDEAAAETKRRRAEFDARCEKTWETIRRAGRPAGRRFKL